MVPTVLKTQLNDGFAQVKIVGHDRFGKIGAILSEFGPQVGAELVAGAKEIGGIGRAIVDVALQILQTQVRTWWADRFAVREKASAESEVTQSAIEVPYKIMEDQKAA